MAAAWIPLRTDVANTDLALALVLLIGAVGWLAGSRPALVAAVTAGVSFDVLDARPYGTLAMSRAIDVVTALILVLTGLFIGFGAARLARYHRSEDRRTDAFAVVMEASGLVATGEDGQLVTAALASELMQELDLSDCRFHPEPPRGTRPCVARDGSLVGLMATRDHSSASQIDLPVWSQGEVVGHYRLSLGPRQPSRQELRVALSLADQAGAALAQPRNEPPPRGSRSSEPGTGDSAASSEPRHLRVLPKRAADPADGEPSPRMAASQ